MGPNAARNGGRQLFFSLPTIKTSHREEFWARGGVWEPGFFFYMALYVSFYKTFLKVLSISNCLVANSSTKYGGPTWEIPWRHLWNMLGLHGIGWSRNIMPQYTKVGRCYDKYYSRSFQARGALMIALESSTCNTEFNGMTDSVWSGTAQEVSDFDRLWRELMSTNGTLMISLVTTKVHHVDCYFLVSNYYFWLHDRQSLARNHTRGQDFNINLTACGGLWCTRMSPDFVIRSAILHKYCDRIDVKSVSFLRLNKHIGKQRSLLPFHKTLSSWENLQDAVRLQLNK